MIQTMANGGMFRAPETAKIKPKMLYASSKDALRKKLVGIATEIQGTDLSEIAHDVVLDKVSKSVSHSLSLSLLPFQTLHYIVLC